MTHCCCKECQEYEQYKYRTHGKVKCYNKDCRSCSKDNICNHGDSKCIDRKKSFNALDWYKKGFLKEGE